MAIVLPPPPTGVMRPAVAPGRGFLLVPEYDPANPATPRTVNRVALIEDPCSFSNGADWSFEKFERTTIVRKNATGVEINAPEALYAVAWARGLLRMDNVPGYTKLRAELSASGFKTPVVTADVSVHVVKYYAPPVPPALYLIACGPRPSGNLTLENPVLELGVWRRYLIQVELYVEDPGQDEESEIVGGTVRVNLTYS